MTVQERITSLEQKLMEIKYVPSTEVMSGYVKPLLMKETIGVHLRELVSLGYGEDVCAMEIHIPSRNPLSTTPINGYHLLFATHDGVDGRWYVRRFPYAEVRTCSRGREDDSTCILSLSDEGAAIRTIVREVQFTQRMIEDSDKRAALESSSVRIPTGNEIQSR